MPTTPSHPPLQPDHVPHAIHSPVPSPQPWFGNFLFQLDQRPATHAPTSAPSSCASSLLRAPPTAGKGSPSCAPRNWCPGHPAHPEEETKVQAAYLKQPALQEGGKRLLQKEGNELRTSSVEREPDGGMGLPLGQMDSASCPSTPQGEKEVGGTLEHPSKSPVANLLSTSWCHKLPFYQTHDQSLLARLFASPEQGKGKGREQ